MSNKIFSFDIFDTAIMRKTLNPTGIFYVMEYRLKSVVHDKFTKNLTNCMDDFAKIRIASETLVRKESNKNEITIYDIYEVIKSKYSLSNEEVNLLIKLETSFEIDMCVGVTRISNIIKKLQISDKKVVFISDMYLPQSIVLEILNTLGININENYVYVSSHENQTKHDGKLFIVVSEKHQCSLNNIVHIGDNIHSDYIIPSSLSIDSYLFTECINNRYEEQITNLILNESNNDIKVCMELLLGTSKICRVNNPKNNKISCSAYEIAVNIAAPIFVSFVEWVLQQAQKKRIQKICFLARDGQIFYEIAKKIARRRMLHFKFIYLYGSRVAWLLPALDTIDEDYIERILYAPEPENIDNLANRLGINSVTFINELQKFSSEKLELHSKINREQLDKIKKIFYTSEFQYYLLKIAEEKRELVLKYLQQCEIVEGSFCIVDLGWNGSSQYNLKKIITIAGKTCNIEGLYLGLFTNKYSSTDNRYKSYLFGPATVKSTNSLIPGMQEIYETLAAADHGLTIGYESDNGTISPIFNNSTNLALKGYDLQSFRQGIFDYLDVYLEHDNFFKIYDPEQSVQYLLQLFEAFKLDPKKEYAELCSHYYHSVDMVEHKFIPLSIALPEAKYHKIVHEYGKDKMSWYRYKEAHWPEASFLLSKCMQTN